MNDLEKLAKVVKESNERTNFFDNATKFCSEKGNSLEYPENSVMALKTVTRHCFTEFDVNISKDGCWVVMNDDTVDRMTNGTGRVDSLTFAQLRALRIDSGANLKVLSDSDKIIPSLEEAIQYCKTAGRIPFIEIKNNTYSDAHLNSFVNTLNQHNIINNRCLVISTNKTILERLRKINNQIQLVWTINSVTQTELNECIRLKLSANVAYNHSTVTREMVSTFHNKGLLFNVWTAPDTAFDSLREKGVDVITTTSRSGDLRWSALSLENGFTSFTSGGLLRVPFVEEVSPGVARVTFTISGGVNTKDQVILTLPDWAAPLYASWHNCTIRTSAGSAPATVDVHGKLTTRPGAVVTGLDWGSRTSWVNSSFIYDLY